MLRWLSSNMGQFRLILILVGIILLLGIYWKSRRGLTKSASGKSRSVRPKPIPMSGDVAAQDRPYRTAMDAEPTRKHRKRYVKFMHGSKAASDHAHSLYNISKQPEPFAVTVFVLPHAGITFRREQVIHCLKSIGCIARGDQGYDYVLLNDKRASRVSRLFTVRDVHEPGIFSGHGEAEASTNGLLFEMQLPGPMESVMAFEKLLDIARLVATKLNGMVCDDLRNRLTRQATLHIKDRIVDYNRKLRVTQSSPVQ